jgi:hypothetical protein
MLIIKHQKQEFLELAQRYLRSWKIYKVTMQIWICFESFESNFDTIQLTVENLSEDCKLLNESFNDFNSNLQLMQKSLLLLRVTNIIIEVVEVVVGGGSNNNNNQQRPNKTIEDFDRLILNETNIIDQFLPNLVVLI